MPNHTILLGDCIEGMKSLPEGCIHTCITSPPYFGLRDYGGGDDEIGKEPTVDEFVEKMVEVFRGVRRILRDDGTLWLNLGDSYMSATCVPPPQTVANGCNRGMPTDFIPANRQKQNGLKQKDLIGIPWRVALALQADGWYLRQDIIWHKPNPMPESVEDRCTKAHEYIFMLTKKPRYYYDHEAIKEEAVGKPHAPGNKNVTQPKEKGARDPGLEPDRVWASDGKRNKRSVWSVTTRSFRGAHFATFPKDLITPCILAGTSEHGCCSSCGAPYERDVEKVVGKSKNCPKTVAAHEARGGKGMPTGTVGKSGGGRIDGHTKTIGWTPTCSCDADIVPCTVFDPFTGSGTTAVVAMNNGRNFIGTELNPEYVKLAEGRIADEVTQTLEGVME